MRGVIAGMIAGMIANVQTLQRILKQKAIKNVRPCGILQCKLLCEESPD